MGLGTFGQLIFVSPRNKVVIVRTAGGWGMGAFEWPQIFQYIADHTEGK
jgi:hypothetical protein